MPLRTTDRDDIISRARNLFVDADWGDYKILHELLDKSEERVYLPKDVILRKALTLAFLDLNKIATAGETYDWMASEWPDFSKGAHRDLVGRLYAGEPNPWEQVEKTCPQCGISTVGIHRCLRTFGARGGLLQSWCRECRKKGALKTAKKRTKSRERLQRKLREYEDL